MIVLLVTFLLSIFPVYAEPALEGILDILGFTSRILVATETFPVGRYDITLYAEYAGYRGSNKLRWYRVGTSDFNLAFDGPEGLSSSDPSGLVSPPLTKSFTISDEFGLSLLSPDGTWYTETSRNSDGEQHAKIYQSSDDPNLFFIGFENLNEGGDFDYNDMVLSLKRIIAVGGYWTPINKSTLLAPWISLASLITVAAVSIVYVKHRKKQEN